MTGSGMKGKPHPKPDVKHKNTTKKALAALALLAVASKHKSNNPALLAIAAKHAASTPSLIAPKVPIAPLPIKPLPKANMPKVLPVEIPVPGVKDLVGMKLAGLKAVTLANQKTQIPKVDIPQIEKPNIVPVLKPLPSLKDNGALLQDALSLKKSVLMP